MFGSLAIFSECSEADALAAPGLFPSCPWTRASSIPQAPASPRIRITLTGRTSSNWPRKAVAMPLLQPSACLARKSQQLVVIDQHDKRNLVRIFAGHRAKHAEG